MLVGRGDLLGVRGEERSWKLCCCCCCSSRGDMEGEELRGEELLELLGGLELLATEQSVSDVWPESHKTAPMFNGGGLCLCRRRPRPPPAAR